MVLFYLTITLAQSLNEIGTYNSAGDTTSHIYDSSLEIVFKNLEHNPDLAVAWFVENYMKYNIIYSLSPFVLLFSCHINYLQCFAKYIWNLIGFTQNLDLKENYNVAYWQDNYKIE